MAFATSGVYALATDAGLLYGGGYLSSYVRAWALQGLTMWNGKANAAVRSLCARGSTLYVGGDFSAVGNEPHPGFAAIVFPQMSIAGPTLVEGGYGTTTDATFKVTLTAPPLKTVTVNYGTTSKTATRC